MRQKKVKVIRRFIYRNQTEERRYVRDPDTGQIYAIGLRRAYQDSKRSIKQLRGKQ